jgi:uncharacterized protein YjiS (DUF1127 family)
MTAHVYTRTASFDNDVASFIQRAFVSMRDWNDARLTRNALGKLTQRELMDIGLNASDINSVSRGTFIR